MGVFESRLVVSLIDKTQSAKGAMANLAGVEKAAKSLGSIKATGLSEISTALAKIGQHREAEKRLTEFAAANEKARARVRALAADMASVEKPTKAAATAYQAATRAADMAARQLARQEGAVQKSAASLKALGIATGEVSAAESRLAAEAARVTSAFEREAAAAQRAARMRASLTREIVRSANEDAAANLRAAAHAEAASKRQIAAFRSVAHSVASVGGMVAGGGVAHVGVRMVENAAEYEQQKNRIFNSAGGKREEVDFAEMVAREAAYRHPIVTRTKALEDYMELRSLSATEAGGIDQQRLHGNVLAMARARQALAAIGMGLSDNDARSLATAIEGSGRAGDPKAQEMMLDAFVRAKGVYGTAIDASKIRDYVANAKAANFPTNDEAFYRTTLARLAEGNASRLGTEFSSTFQTLVGGKMTKQGAQWLAATGMITPDQIVDGKGGKFYIRGDIKEKGLLSADQTAWAERILLPGLEAKGVTSDEAVAKRMASLRDAELKANPNAKIDDHVLRERAMHGLIADDLMRAGFRSTVADNLIHAIANEMLIRKNIAQMNAHTGLGAADTIGRNPVAAFTELTNAVSNFGSVLANPIMGNVASVLDGISHSIANFTEGLSDFQKNHPDLSKLLAVGVPGAAVAGGGALAWGLAGNILGGFGLKGSALALDGSAAALTGAAEALAASAGTSLLGKGAPVAGAAVGGAAVGWKARLWNLGKMALRHPATWGISALVGANAATLQGLAGGSIRADPGDLLGDQYRRTHPRYDADAARRKTEEHGDLVREMRREAARGRAMSSPMRITKPEVDAHSIWPGASGAGAVGKQAGVDLGSNVAQGISEQAGAVDQAALALLDRVRSILSAGVDVPVRVNASGAGAAQSPVRTALRGALGDTGDSFI